MNLRAKRRLRYLACGSQFLRVRSAESFLERAYGLCGANPFAHCDALRLPACRAIHTFGMRESLDLLFIDRQRRIIRVARAVRPARFRVCLAANEVWELRAGAAARLGLQTGDLLAW